MLKWLLQPRITHIATTGVYLTMWLVKNCRYEHVLGQCGHGWQNSTVQMVPQTGESNIPVYTESHPALCNHCRRENTNSYTTTNVGIIGLHVFFKWPARVAFDFNLSSAYNIYFIAVIQPNIFYCNFNFRYS